MTRRTLTESATLDGTLGYKGSYELYDRLAEAGTFTWLPAVGDVIGRGGTLFRINNLPVVLMYGTVPAYRTLEKGVSNGPDVAELNRNLKALGFDPYDEISELDHFSAATARPSSAGRRPRDSPQTGKVELGRVIFAPAAQRVTKLDVSLGQDPPGTTGATGPTGPTGIPPRPKRRRPRSRANPSKPEKAPRKRARAHRNIARAPPRQGLKASRQQLLARQGLQGTFQGRLDRTTSKPSGSKGNSRSGSKQPNGTNGAAPSSSEGSKTTPATPKPVRSEDARCQEPGRGQKAGAARGQLVLSTTSTATGRPARREGRPAAARPHRRVSSGDAPERTGRPGAHHGSRHRGERIEQRRQRRWRREGESSGNGENATIPVTLTLDHPVSRLDEAPVSVELVKNVSHNVLAVPATALTATAGGGYAIEALEGDHRVEVPVTPGHVRERLRADRRSGRARRADRDRVRMTRRARARRGTAARSDRGAAADVLELLGRRQALPRRRRGAARRRPDACGGRAVRDRRALGVGQVDAAAHHGNARTGDERARADRRRGRLDLPRTASWPLCAPAGSASSFSSSICSRPTPRSRTSPAGCSTRARRPASGAAGRGRRSSR